MFSEKQVNPKYNEYRGYDLEDISHGIYKMTNYWYYTQRGMTTPPTACFKPTEDDIQRVIKIMYSASHYNSARME